MPLLPASFGPMILKMILGKKILPKLSEAIANHVAKMFKLNQVVDYMELPNDADKLGKKNQEQINMLASEMSVIGEKNQEQINMLAGNMSVIENRLKKLEILGGKTKKIKSNGK